MFQGTTTKLSESKQAATATISVKTDIVVVTGTGPINKIIPNFGGGNFSGFVILVPLTAGLVLGTSDNILTGITTSNAVLLVYVKSLTKWVILGAL